MDIVCNLAYEYCFVLIAWVCFAKQNHCIFLHVELCMRCPYHLHISYIRMTKKRIWLYHMHAAGCLSQVTSILSKYLLICFFRAVPLLTGSQTMFGNMLILCCFIANWVTLFLFLLFLLFLRKVRKRVEKDCYQLIIGDQI